MIDPSIFTEFFIFNMSQETLAHEEDNLQTEVSLMFVIENSLVNIYRIIIIMKQNKVTIIQDINKQLGNLLIRK